jgi:hypothetical protein
MSQILRSRAYYEELVFLDSPNEREIFLKAFKEANPEIFDKFKKEDRFHSFLSSHPRAYYHLVTNRLPKEFPYWDINDPYEKSLAHFAIKLGLFPGDVTQEKNNLMKS